jgi:hypothetical protein
MDYRQTIVEEAAVMFRTYGIRAVTMDMLASHLGISMMGNHFQKMSPAFQMDMKRYHNEILRKPGDQVEFPYSSSNSEIIKRGIREGVFRKDIDVDITNKCMLEVAKMSNDKTVFPSDDYVSKDVVRTFYLNYLRGISTQKGLDLINLHDKKHK